ncbi:MAG: tetratricopeptide repeat protein [Candidatus Heimdallarchaeota archaeon]|nr:tetratricopeptide repeat protein [Candidatus Heimdallarchaeota archaeon]MCK5047777.1 tetratricopeptide repeat protein [Candidatus Heimdallarchaeota archaeon]
MDIQPHLNALQIIIDKIKEEEVDWLIVGSLNLFLQGLPVEPKDIDISTDKDGAFTFGKVLKEYERSAVSFSSKEKIRSYFGTYEINRIKIEIMGDLETKDKEGKWTAEGLSIKERVKIIHEVKEMKLPLTTLNDELIGYQRIERPEKVELIRAWLALSREEVDQELDPLMITSLAIALHEKGDIEMAELAFQKATTYEPENASFWFNLGIFYDNESGFEEAEEAYRIAIDLEPDNFEAWKNLGTLLFELERFEEAKVIFLRVIKEEPQETHFKNLLAETLLELKEYKKAEKTLRKLLKKKSMKTDIGTLNNLALALMYQENFEEAEETYLKALDVDQNSSIILYNYACLKAIEDKKEEAIIFLKQAILQDPENKERALEDPDFGKIKEEVVFQKLLKD